MASKHKTFQQHDHSFFDEPASDLKVSFLDRRLQPSPQSASQAPRSVGQKVRYAHRQDERAEIEGYARNVAGIDKPHLPKR
jgi:hypothetical protein